MIRMNTWAWLAISVLAAVLVLVATTSVAVAGRWGGHQTGGGVSTTLLPPPPFVGVSPAPGTPISFGTEAKADSLVPAPAPAPPGTLQRAPGSTLQGNATWIDHTTSPPRMITLRNPALFRCNPVSGQGRIAGWGTDSGTPGAVWVNFGTLDGQAPGPPLRDEVFIRVLLAPPPPPPFPAALFLYWAVAAAGGEVVQHSCQ